MEGKTRKRKSFGRITDVAKKLIVQSHEIGVDCQCKRFKCFSKIRKTERRKILGYFNQLETLDEQNSYLAGLITVMSVNRRRPRCAESKVSRFNDASYAYRVRSNVEDENENIVNTQVCYEAFLSQHGITPRRIQSIQTSVKEFGSAKKYGRDRHKNKPHKLTNETVNKVCQHISSFRDISSHYSLEKSFRTYLSEKLNVTKMYDLFKIKFPQVKISYNRYREIFNDKFNIGFGYPRSDTCSKCDETAVVLETLESTEAKAQEYEKPKLLTEIEKLETEKKVYLSGANAFNDRKRAFKR
ncbi:unnamed protein product [Psylliodes chrysocephalus]|uniref:Uncharacterized protein n=1 Tax=Psylliodes chrysocephalus TaxID=3402493 RepID=A0A9P0CTD3_9CUCU|nr:unnamed protein product [Psylliodes chrysocephala]